MAVKMIVDSAEEIPAALKDEYEERDGKFHLKLDGAEDTTGLRSALQKERAARAELEKQMKTWKDLGKSPDEIAALAEAHKRAEEEKARKSGDFDKLLKQHQETAAAERKKLEEELNAARSSERQAIVNERLTAALSRAGITAEGLALLPNTLSNRIHLETDNGKRKIVIRAEDGETPLAGSGEGGIATFDDLAAEAVKKFPSLFKSVSGSGSGKQPEKGAGGAGAKEISRADFDKLDAVKRAEVARSGTRIVD